MLRCRMTAGPWPATTRPRSCWPDTGGRARPLARSRRASCLTIPFRTRGWVSLPWIYVHMIEESARHVGHADMLREQTDGATGFDG